MTVTFLKTIRTRQIVATLLLLTAAFAACAGQLALSYVDANGQSQILTVDRDSSTQDLALAADLVGEFGVGLSFDASTGSGSLAEIAAAMAAAAPQYAADIAQALSAMSPTDSDAIVAAVNAIDGVNTEAVLAAAHFGAPSGRGHRPPIDGLNPPGFEHVPSRN